MDDNLHARTCIGLAWNHVGESSQEVALNLSFIGTVCLVSARTIGHHNHWQALVVAQNRPDLAATMRMLMAYQIACGPLSPAAPSYRLAADWRFVVL